MTRKLRAKPHEECSEKQWHVKFYNNAVGEYAEAVNELRLGRGRTSKDDYAALLSASEKARLSAESARQELEEHIRMHNC